MDTNELTDRLNTLTAQNIALTHMLAAVIKATGADVENEYRLRCAITRSITEPNADKDARAIQRKVFKQIGVLCGARDARAPE